MEKVEIFWGIFTLILSSILSCIVSLIVSKIEINRNNKKEIFSNFYNRFYVLRDSIHQGRAFNFTDLTCKNQERIVKFLIETDYYQTEEISNMVYELKTNRLNNFDNLNKANINKCNDIYNLLSEKLMDKYYKLKNLYV